MSSKSWCQVCMLAVATLSLGPRAALAGDCAVSVSTQDLTEILERAELAYQDMNLDGFQAEADQAARALPCSGEVLPRTLLARYHRLQGLRAFVARDADRVPLAFAAARSIEPAYVLPEAMVPLDHPLRETYGAVPVESRLTVVLPQPAEGYLLMDGRESPDRPTNLPVVMQRVSEAGEVIVTVYLWPENPAPEYEIATPTAPVADARGAPGRSRLGVGLSVGSGVALVGSGVSFALSRQTRGHFYDLSTPPGELEGLNQQIRFQRAGALAGLALGFAAAGGAVAVFVWE